MASRKSVLIAFAAAVGLFPWPSLAAVWTSLDGSKALVRNSSGAVVRLQVPTVLPSVAAGGGAASLKASQALVIGNVVADLQLTRNVPVANLATVLRVASRVAGPVALLGLAYEGIQWLDGQWFTDPRVGDIPVGKTYPSNYPFNCNTGTIGQTAAYQFDSANIEIRQVVDYSSGSPPSGWQLQESCGWKSPRTATVRKFIAGTCDSLSSANGFSCVEGGEPELATSQQVEQALEQALASSPSLAGQLLDGALQDSEARAQLLADALVISGPSTLDGGTTTSTRVDTAGTTTTLTQTTYNLSYQGDTVNLTQTQVETVTDPANNVTTITTTTDTPTGDPPPPDEPPDLCAENPDASGCAPFGTPEPPTPLAEEDRTVSVAPEMSAAGACPAPQAFSIAGQSFQLTYDGACEFAQGIRPVVLAVAWMGAFVFLFSIGRAQTS